VAADREEGADDVVARLQPGHAGADLLDDARALVAADDREPRHDVAMPEVLVGVAQTRGDEADQHLPRLGLVEVDLGDLERLPDGAQNGCSGLHGPSRFVGPTGPHGLPPSAAGVIRATPERGWRRAAESPARRRAVVQSAAAAALPAAGETVPGKFPTPSEPAAGSTEANGTRTIDPVVSGR
jgi:hypothetical protein